MRITITGCACCLAVSSLSLTSSARACEDDAPLVTAVAERDVMALRALLSRQDIDVNTTRADGTTALIWAAHWDDVNTLERLLAAGADPNLTDDYGVTALARAAENASASVTGKLLEADADPNVAQESGLTPLMIAAHTGHPEVVRALLHSGAEVNAVTVAEKATPLMWAVTQGHHASVRALIAGGANVDSSTVMGFTPLMYAADTGDIEAAKMLIAAGADVNHIVDIGVNKTHPLPLSIVNGHTEFALFLLAEGADPEGTIGGIGALHAAAGPVGLWRGDWGRAHGRGASDRIALKDRLWLVRALLEHGANPNRRITASGVVLEYVVGRPKKGAFEPYSVGTGDLRGATPLWVAAYATNGAGGQSFLSDGRSASNAEIVRALLAWGADQHLSTADGTTPLMAAAGLGRATYTPGKPRGVLLAAAEETVKVLLDSGADVNAVNEADYSALHSAAFRGQNEIVRLLVKHGADINARDARGRTPYRIAEGSKQSFQFQTWPETAALLAELGANVRLGIPGDVQERSPRDVLPQQEE